MSDEPDNLVLVYLRRMDAKLNQVIDTQNEHSQRLTHIEAQIAGIRRDQGSDAEGCRSRPGANGQIRRTSGPH